MDPMQVPIKPIKLRKAQAAIRQINSAIDALEMGDFDIAITLAGAAESMTEVYHPHIWEALVNHPRVKELDKRQWIATLNEARDWLKHPTNLISPVREFSQQEAAIMVARAASKIENWSPQMERFKIWFLDRVDNGFH